MKGKLILTSGGYIDGQRGEVLDSLIEEASIGKKVLILDNATTTGSNKSGCQNVYDNFAKLTKNIEKITLNTENLAKIKDFDVIYITGGDVGPLLDLAQAANLKDLFIPFLQEGGCIIGESAGSMIFAHDLKYIYQIKRGVKPKWDVVRDSYKGIGMVDVNIYPHFQKVSQELRQKVDAYEKDSNIKVTRLNDGEYIIFSF